MQLVLLPGMNCSPLLWADVLPLLPPNVEPLAMHVEGTSIEEAIEEVARTAPQRFALAGLSLGGIVGMAVARLLPDRVERLCLLDTSARPPTPAQLDGWHASIARLEAGAGARDIQTELLPVLLAPGYDEGDRPVDLALQMAQEVGAQRLAEQFRIQLTRVDERPGLRELRVPTQVICGQLDALCPVARHQEIAALVPGSRLTVIEGAGHLAPIEAPAQVAAAMTDWLTRPVGEPVAASRGHRSGD